MRFFVLLALTMPLFTHAKSNLEINDLNYFETPGLNVTVFSDIYPEGHQTGISVIQHGVRVAANGDLRLETSPGQWSPVPAGGELKVDKSNRTISQTLSYPDPTKNRIGFNPIVYPDLEFTYSVSVTALEGNSFKITVDLEKPLPDAWIGKVGFNFELFPGHLFGRSYLMDDHSGIFTPQPNGPLVNQHDEWLTGPLATGEKLVIAPGEEKQKITIESKTAPLELWDGRSNHNNGWYIVRTPVPKNKTKNAVEWVITPNVVPDWIYQPVIQVSQLGYTPAQPKQVIIEQDKRDKKASQLSIYKLTHSGREKVADGKPRLWGKFLRYNYLRYDFSDIRDAGMYVVEYRGKTSQPFRIDSRVYDRHAWQPTLEYYLPVQMCHMRVNEKYRVWHGLCHHDDALMSPVNLNHFDGYKSGPSTLTQYEPLEPVPGLNAGGWHDAGDYDLRVESQMTTVWLLSMMVEEFGLDYDSTLIDQNKKLVEIHVADGKSDALQQIEHGLLSVMGAYKSLGRLYRGIIVPTVRQYVLLGDGSTQTDGLVYDPTLEAGKRKPGYSPVPDDRYVFTEENPIRELNAGAGLAAAARVLKEYNPTLANEALDAAKELYRGSFDKTSDAKARAFILAELILATGDNAFKQKLVSIKEELVGDIANTGWAIGRVISLIDDKQFASDISAAVRQHQDQVQRESLESPYGVPYKPNIWGAGWTIQAFGVRQYFFHKTWPEHTSPDSYLNALNFVLGVHPGENTLSFASGVGSESALVAYGVNRADWSYIPGGVISGTALIRPDLPELKIWPFFWQQTEYVMGGGATNYMFLVLAADALHGD